jgi:hypothetical protein
MIPAKILELPEQPEPENEKIDFLENDAGRAPDDEQPAVETIDGLPAIALPGNGLLIGDFAGELGKHLSRAGVFARQGCAFTLDYQGQKLEAVTPGWLRTWIEKHVRPYRAERGENDTIIRIKKSITEDIARAVNVSPQFLAALPRVERFCPCPMPTMREDGRIELLSPGMDAESLTFTADAGFPLEVLPVERATTTLRDLLEEFAWPEDGGRSLAVHISAMLTVFARGILPRGTTTPVFLYLANSEGAGKTLLASLAGICYQELPPAEAAPRDESEWQKKLLSLVVSGRRLVLLDNLKGHLDSPSLEAYTTSPSFAGRILGVTREFCGEAGATLLLTGNRLTISPDMRRRSLIVELFMSELRAEDRKFRRILDTEAIRKLRPTVLSALWSIVHAWDKAGRPPCTHSSASFPRWAQTIAGMVEFAGFTSPLVPAEIEGMGDTDTADFAALVAKLEPGKRYTFAEIAEIADDAGLFERIFCEREKDGELSRAGKRRLSDLLGRFDRRRVSASCVFSVEGKGHARRYAVISPRRMHDTHDTHDILPFLEKPDFSIRPKYHAHHAYHAYDPDMSEEELARKEDDGEPFRA